MQTDEDQLNLLVIFHYVVGGMLALFSCFPIIHFGIGLAILLGAIPQQPGRGNPQEAQLVGGVFVAVASTIMLLGWTTSGLIIYAGRCLARRRRYTLCMVAAAISCLFMPFGTVLGIFTLIVLNKPSVRALFDQPEAEPT